MILDFLLLFSFHDFAKFVGPRSDWLTLSNHIIIISGGKFQTRKIAAVCRPASLKCATTHLEL